jgi:tetratricopeptide (TPR) repeat protein
MRYCSSTTDFCPAGLVWAVALLAMALNRPGFGQELPAPLERKIAAGVKALKAGDLDTADRVFTELLHQGTRNALIFHNLGVIAQERGNHQEAVTRFRQAIRLQPSYGPSRLLLGSSLWALGKNEDALREFKRAIVLMPDQPAARLELAKAYESSGNWIAAVEQLQKLVSLAPDNAENSYQLGKALTKLSGWSLREIARLNPNSARLHQALGQEYAIQEKYDQALAAYQQAAQSDPKLPEIHLGMALILLQLKRLDEALEQVQLELTLVPQSKRALAAKAKIEAAKAASAP